MSHHKDYKYILINDKINETVKNIIEIINYNLLIQKIHDNSKNKLKYIK